ncbi:AAA family ATPase [Photobacterium satsumensis]|uniref:AAA family ATPase n=1 Tax=Photobacterium satsumensis TaxID=2910239 RepID=UPI003D1026EF
MNTKPNLSNNETLAPSKKAHLPASLSGWIVSENKDFVNPLGEYFMQWSNVKFNAITQFSLNSQLKNKSDMKNPDLIIIDGDMDWTFIAAKIKSTLSSKIPVILISNDSSAETLKKAIRIEIKDVLSIPFDQTELDQIIVNCSKSKSENRKQGVTTIFINAKGGMGASIISTSVAHMIALQNESIVLIDPDAQFGSTSSLLSTPPKHTLSEALSQVESLDEYATSGLLTKHESGLRFIPNRTEHLLDAIPDFDSESFREFLEHIKNGFQHIVIDVSRGLDNNISPALSNADNIFIVVQQNIPSLKEASILIRKLKHLFGFNNQQVKIIVNRYSKNLDISPDEIKQSLHCDTILLVPNDYLSVSASTNLGELLATHFDKKPIVKSLKEVANLITNKQETEAKGVKRFFTFLRS